MIRRPTSRALILCAGLQSAFCTAAHAARPLAAPDELLDRPLFSPTRRAAPHAAATGPADETPVLTGIIRTPHATLAVFQTHDGSQPRPQASGSRIGDWTLRSVDSRTAVLERDGRILALHPLFAPETPKP
ncbi:hypothetical protein [Brytella acorum]|uniref:Type II secretion system protein GspC N-terminal domain-containing protein n=1 Tax=Brytella acorum TaxID=2959299 RepID=A0AA35UFB7_9PROT|nr:hypothetical protein [Brytella acorum]MDF3624773.1 hypothetical protein [Brytella acorum]CAI9120076.1 hypothetical protein LMG32879_000905 [Brytella acorum]